mmetsp:Transcript_85368/g.241966  ORF Transcript_85368/g.241966 Transcript_85368/m.241966 type:complete len:320 (+) Transcript_85368:381-1340(+)
MAILGPSTCDCTFGFRNSIPKLLCTFVRLLREVRYGLPELPLALFKADEALAIFVVEFAEAPRATLNLQVLSLQHLGNMVCQCTHRGLLVPRHPQLRCGQLLAALREPQLEAAGKSPGADRARGRSLGWLGGLRRRLGPASCGRGCGRGGRALRKLAHSLQPRVKRCHGLVHEGRKVRDGRLARRLLGLDPPHNSRPGGRLRDFALRAHIAASVGAPAAFGARAPRRTIRPSRQRNLEGRVPHQLSEDGLGVPVPVHLHDPAPRLDQRPGVCGVPVRNQPVPLHRQDLERCLVQLQPQEPAIRLVELDKKVVHAEGHCT